MRPLKALHLVEENNEYMIVATYRNANRSLIEGTPEFSTTILDHSTDYQCIKDVLTEIETKNGMKAFDCVSVTVEESLALMKGN